VIFVTHRPPLPLDTGARIRAHRLAVGMAERCDVTLVTYEDGPTFDETRTTREELEAALPGVTLELVPYKGDQPGGLRRHMLARSSASYGHHHGSGMSEALARLTSRGPAVLHLDDPGAGVESFAPHNVEYRIIKEIAEDRPALQRLPLIAEWRKIRAEERRLYKASEICIAVSEIDAAEMRSHGARRVEIVPNGADAGETAPWRPPAAGETMRLLFVGTGNYWPYALGLAWFVREVMPRLENVQFDVVGAPPENPVQAPGVTYHGRVPEVQSFYDNAHALVIPVFQGSGTRLKVVEAGVLGRPVVSTALGAEGLPVAADEHFLRAEDPESFVQAIERIRTDAESTNQMIDRARDALDGFLWPRIADRLAEIYSTRVR
jgi:glycosyltransferase involved in cell wall biosynthesis